MSANDLNTSRPNETAAELAARFKTGDINKQQFFTNALSHTWNIPMPGVSQDRVKQVLGDAQKNPNPYLKSLQRVPNWMIESVIKRNPAAFNSVGASLPPTTKVALALCHKKCGVFVIKAA